MPYVGEEPRARRVVITETLGYLKLEPMALRTDLKDAAAVVPRRIDAHEGLEKYPDLLQREKQVRVCRSIHQWITVRKIQEVDAIPLSSG